MRSAALIFGLLAGLCGGVVVALGTLESGLAGALGTDATAARLIVCLVPYLGLLGAGLALGRPRLGALLMLLSALGWAAVALLAGHGAVLFGALPFTFAGAGGLVALFSSRRRDEDDADEEPELPAAEPARRWEDAPEPAPPLRRSRFARNEPAFEPAPSHGPPQPGFESRRSRPRPEPDFSGRPGRQPPPVFEVEPPLDDEVPAEDYIDAEAEFEAEPLADDSYPYEELDAAEEAAPAESTPPETDDFAEPDVEAEFEEPWLSDEPEDEPEAEAEPEAEPEPRYATGRQPARPSRREAAPPPAPEDDYDVPPEDYVAPGEAPPPRYRPYDESVGHPPHRGTPLRGFRRLLTASLAVVVVLGLGAAVYFDYQRGPQSLLFGRSRQVAATAAVAPVPAASASPAAPVAPVPAAETPPNPPAVAAAPPTDTSAAPPDLTSVTPSLPPDAATPADSAAAPSSAAPPPAAPAGAAPSPAAPQPAYLSAANDPFRYCQAVGTIDAPDARFTGPAVPHAVAAALQLSDSAPADQVRWRCVNQQLLACNVNHGAACDMTPTAELMLSYCAQHPDTQGIPAPNGSWSCNGTHPVIPPDQKWPVDSRGFFPSAWLPVPPAAAG